MVDVNPFLDGKYTNKQIDAINNLKGKEIKKPNEEIKGDSGSIFDDLNSYDSKKENKSNNADLLDYIEKNYGMDNFMQLLDADGDGKVSKDESSKLSSYDKNKELTSSDVTSFVKDVKAVKEGTVESKKADGTTVETEFGLVKGKLQKKSQTTGEKGKQFKTEYTYGSDGKIASAKESAVMGEGKDAVTTPTKEFSYDKNGDVKSKKDLLHNTTVEYTYKEIKNKDGKVIKRVKSSAIEKDKDGKKIAELTYNEAGKVSTKKDLVTARTTTYTYDDHNHIKSSKVVLTGTDKVVAENEYNEKGQIASATFNYSPGTGIKAIPPVKYEYEYDEFGRRIKAKFSQGDREKEYEFSYPTDKYFDLPSLRKCTKDSKGLEEGQEKHYTYTDGLLTEVEFKDKDGNTIKTGKINPDGTYASITEGDFTTLFEYDENHLRSKDTKYNKDDIGEDGKPKDGVEALETSEYKDGVISKTTTKEGDVTEYDEEGKKVKTTTKDGDVTEYGDDGKPTKTTRQDGSYVEYKDGAEIEYNSEGKKIKETKGGVVTEYDPVSGNKTKETKSDGTVIEYKDGKKSKETKPDGTVVNYDESGNEAKDEDKKDEDNK